MIKRVIVTTSWDDGHKLDTRLAGLLGKYNLPGTFYISPRDHEFDRQDLLTNAQVQELAQRFEIGAHTMTHPRLPEISDDDARQEIADSKQYLEALTGKPVVSFCYPGGNYHAQHVRMAEELGFCYARTVKRHVTDLKDSVFEAHTAVNAYNHYQDLPKILKFAGYNPLKVPHYFKWENLAMAMFDRIRRQGGIFHLWGHSWEIDQHGDWDKLERVLAHIAGHRDVYYATNGELPDLQSKKVLIAAPYFPPHLGGQEQYAYNLAKRLQADYGWDVSVVTTGGRGMRAKREVYKGVEVHRLPYWFKLSNTPINAWWPRMLGRLIIRQQVSIVNAHAPVPGLGDMAVMVSGRVPSAVTYHMGSMKKHDWRYDWLINFYESRILPATLRKARAAVAISSFVQDTHMLPYADKSVVISPGTDVGFFVPAKELAPDTVLFVGSINKSDNHKGLKYLLAAFAAVASQHPRATLRVVGDGTARPYFEQLAATMGLTGRVVFLGALTGEDLKAAYQSASMLVLPSLNESFGMVVIEAMACGLPVIGTRVGEIPAIVNDGVTGFVVPPADSTALAQKISHLLTDHSAALSMGKAGRARAAAEYSWEEKVRATDAMLRRSMGMTAGGKQ